MVSKTQERPFWLSPVGWFLYAVVLVVCLTVLAAIWKVKHKQAERSFDQIVAKADAEADPRIATKHYEAYIKHRPDNALTRRARQKLKDAQDRVDKFEYEQVLRQAEQAGESYELVGRLWQTYLNSKPKEPYRKQAEERVLKIPDQIDDRDFARLNREFPANTPNLEARREALQAYLVGHPQGRHAEASRKALVQIPDAMDQRTFKTISDEAGALATSGKVEEALDRIDDKGAQLVSQKRKDDLKRLRGTLAAELERKDLQKILAMPADEVSQQKALRGACRLFLLCYPTSKDAAAVRSRMESVIQIIGAAEWQMVQQTVDANLANPEVCLKAVDGYLQHWPEAMSIGTVRASVCTCYARVFVDRFSKLTFPQVGTVTRGDGTTVAGALQEAGNAYYVNDAASGKRLATILKADMKEFAPSEVTTAASTLKTQIATMDPAHLDVAALQSAAALARKHDLRSAVELICILLARIDADSPETKRILESNGFRRAGGRWVSQDEATDSTMLDRLVDRYSPAVTDGVKTTMQQLPLTVTYTRLGTKEKVPIECIANLAATDVLSVQRESSGMKASVKFRFRTTLQAKETMDSESFRNMLKGIASEAECEAVLDIVEVRTNQDGIGIAVAKQAESWVITGISIRGPAKETWVEPGDVVLSVNDKPLLDAMTQQEVTDLLAGPTGEAALKLKRSGRRFTVKVPKDEWTESLYQGRYYIRHNLNSAGSLQMLPWTELQPFTDM